MQRRNSLVRQCKARKEAGVTVHGREGNPYRDVSMSGKQIGEIMLTNDELMAKIEMALDGFEGDITEFYTAVGMVVVGRLIGWKVMRLVSSRKTWRIANELFGDIKDPAYLMRERTERSARSVGLKITDALGEYWEYVQGHKYMDLADRRGVK